MVKTFVFSIVSLAFTIHLYSQGPIENFNIELMSHVPIGHDCNDVWGFTDTMGTEYAVIGSRIGTHIFSLEDPTKPKLRYVAEGARSIWRDIKYYKGYLYVTADQDTFGLTIIDVRKAPDTISHTQWKPIIQIGNNTGRLLRAHNLYIDSLGFAYLAGHNLSRRGVLIMDLNEDPLHPKYVSAVDRFYSHDAYVQDNQLYSSELNNGFAIYDVTDKAKPTELGRAASSRNFTHNAWLSEDGKTLFTTDEVAGGTVESYNVEDPSSIRFLDKIKTQPGNTRVIPHNTHIMGQYAITSWYTDGIIVKDISDPKQMTIVGAYDTYPQDASLPASSSLFFGCWGAYPYLPSGLILASDINNGLFVLKPSYKKAARLTGKVGMIINEKDTVNINDALVKMVNSDREKAIITGNNQYAFKVAPLKNSTFTFSKPRFDTDTVKIFFREDTTIHFDYYFRATLSTLSARKALDNSLLSGISYQYAQEATNEPAFIGEGASSTAEILSQTSREEKIIGGKWGTNFVEAPLTKATIELKFTKAYEDPMVFNTGWTVKNNTFTGHWELGKPNGSTQNGNSRVPSSDVESDLGVGAWVTGNSKENPLDDFVTGGTNVLSSPYFDLSQSSKVSIKNYLWYACPLDHSMQDSLTVHLVNNRGQKILLDIITSRLTPWTLKEYVIEKEAIPFTDSMQLIYTVSASDESFDIEAGVDDLRITPQALTNIASTNLTDVNLYPNPTTGILRLSTDDTTIDKVNIYTTTGVLISQLTVTNRKHMDISDLATGSYILQIFTGHQNLFFKIIKN